MQTLYRVSNGPMVTTAAPVMVTTGTTIKTLLQVAAPATRELTVVRWGITFNGAPNNIKVELIDTNVAATVTAHVAAGVQPYNDANAPASLVTLGTTATGYTATAEGTVTASRMIDFQSLSGNYVSEDSLAREGTVGVSRFLRVRVTAAAAVDAHCFIIYSES